MLHGIKVFEKKKRRLESTNKENQRERLRVKFQNEGNSERGLNKGTTKLVETTGKTLNV